MKSKKTKNPINLANTQNIGIMQSIDENQKIITMQQGSFSDDSVWFLKDENGVEFVVFPQDSFSTLIGKIKATQEERLITSLEKDIISQMPIDIDDVMALARSQLESLRQNDGYLPKINTKSFAKDMRIKYPNLFFDMFDYLRKQD